MPSRRRLCLIGSILALSACGIKPSQTAPDRTLGTIITREQIAESGARTMWDAVTRLVRFAQFQESGRVQRRGSSSIVLAEDMPIYIDRVRVINIQLLGSLLADHIERIQVLSGLDATTYFGTNSGDGVILIYTIDPSG